MKVRVLLVLAMAVIAAMPASAGGKKKKEQPRGMLERMEAVPCGAKQRGLNGLGSVWASVGVTHVNSDEKLCPQYLLRTDEMDYVIRPVDLKHPVVLPVGHEVLFKIKKDRMTLKVPDGDQKSLKYQVVSMKQSGDDKDGNSDQPSGKQ